jgi:hypothetical protein
MVTESTETGVYLRKPLSRGKLTSRLTSLSRHRLATGF